MIDFYMKLKAGVFPYLWLKAIRGFNPKDNYAACLLGEYETQVLPFGLGIKKNGTVRGILKHPAPYYVLCGIPHEGLEYALYILFREKQGERISYEDTRAIVKILNAKRLDLPPLTKEEIDVTSWRQDAPKSISPCYRLGWHYLLNTVPKKLFEI
ncbi:MAG: hypothetical protein WCG34_09260 [Leptolinea sp.]